MSGGLIRQQKKKYRQAAALTQGADTALPADTTTKMIYLQKCQIYYF